MLRTKTSERLLLSGGRAAIYTLFLQFRNKTRNSAIPMEALRVALFTKTLRVVCGQPFLKYMTLNLTTQRIISTKLACGSKLGIYGRITNKHSQHKHVF